MMNVVKKFFLLLVCVTTCPIAARSNDTACPTYYLYALGGASIVPCTRICVDERLWDPALEGYDSRLGTRPVVGFGAGYYLCDWLALGASADHRSNFAYCKRQTPPENAESVPGFLGAKTRFFNLDNTSFMLTSLLKYTIDKECWSGCWSAVTLKPYAGLGIGLSKTTLYNFHTIINNSIPVGTLTSFPARSIMSPIVTNKFAWQAEIGFDVSACDCLVLTLAYRYFDGGKFFSNNYIIDVPTGFTTPLVAPPWMSHFRAHELIAKIQITF